MIGWKKETARLGDVLSQLVFSDSTGRLVEVDRGFDAWRRKTLALRKAKKAIYLVGNGASASMASHYAADLAKNAHLHTEVFSDLSLVTAISNDLGYENVFSEPLRRRGKRGDMLVAISSSGRSRNILKAVDTARRLGLVVITLSAMDAKNPLRSRGTLNAYVPADEYGLAESCHAAILHHWMDRVEVRRETKR